MRDAHNYMAMMRIQRGKKDAQRRKGEAARSPIPGTFPGHAGPERVRPDFAFDESLPNAALEDHPLPLTRHQFRSTQRTRVQLGQHLLGHLLQTSRCIQPYSSMSRPVSRSANFIVIDFWGILVELKEYVSPSCSSKVSHEKPLEMITFKTMQYQKLSKF